MSDKEYPIELGGRRWTLGPLPWRVVRQVQPKLLRHSRRLIEGDPSKALARLDENILAEQVECIALAVSTVDAGVNVDVFNEMPLTSASVLAATSQVLRACGLDLEPNPESAANAASPIATA